MKFKSPKPPESVIQLAPMIDIVFLLLIFFLVTWQFSRSEQDSKVKVPTSSQGKEETRAISEINVNIRQGGELVINGETLTDGSSGVTSGIQSVGTTTNLRAQTTHFRNPTGVIGNRAISINGQTHSHGGEHTEGT